MRAAAFFGVASAVQVEVAEHASPLNALRDEMALVEDQIKQAGKITPGVYETVKKLSGMVSKIVEPAIVESHTTDQLLVMTVFREIITCDLVYKKFVNGEKKAQEAALATVRTEWDSCVGSVEALKARFKKCLDERDVLVQHNNTVCCKEHALCTRNGDAASYGDCENVKLNRGWVGCDYRSLTGGECYARGVKLIAELQGYFQAQDMKYEGLRHLCSKFEAGVKAKIAECAYLQQAVNAKVGETNKVAQDIKMGNKKVIQTCKDRCFEYKKCRATAEAQYKKTIGPCQGDGSLCHDSDKNGKWDCDVVMRNGKLVKSGLVAGGKCVKNREVDRQNEWEATQVVKCMLKHYMAGGLFEKKLMVVCEKSITTVHLRIKYPKLPPMIPCTITKCKDCAGCKECVDRPYYQYETPCYSPPAPVATTCMEKPECPGWCDKTPPPTPKPVKCDYNGKTLKLGDSVKVSCVQQCTCKNGGEPGVGRLDCAMAKYVSICRASQGQFQSQAPTLANGCTEKCQTAKQIKLGKAGSCVLWGDPHIITFDNAIKARDRTRNWGRTNANIYASGDFWLVKSRFVKIQGRYFSTRSDGKSATRALAVGGSFLRGNKLVINPRNGKILWNHQQILTKLHSSFRNDLVSCKYDNQIVDARGLGIKVVGVSCQLPLGVRLSVNRGNQHIAVVIMMRQMPGGQDGHCGNFNGHAKDDSSTAIMRRLGKQVAGPELLMPKKPHKYVGCYRDRARRDLPRRIVPNRDEEGCARMCSGYKYFGRQWTNECWCGNSYGRYGKTGGCRLGTAAQTSRRPGIGGWRNAVYKYTDTAVPKPVSMADCKASVRREAQKQCKQAIADSSDFAKGWEDACVFDFCFAGPEFVREDSTEEHLVKRLWKIQ